LGLVERGNILSKYSEDILRGIAGLKVGKEWMRGEVLLGLSFVIYQSSVENGSKIRT